MNRNDLDAAKTIGHMLSTWKELYDALHDLIDAVEIGHVPTDIALKAAKNALDKAQS